MPSFAFFRHAFTFLEIAVVIIIIGILAAMVVPQFSSVTDDAKTASLQGTLGGVRAGIAGYRTQRLLAGQTPFPSLAELTTVGTVLQNEIPENPFNGKSAVQSVSAAAANARTVSNTSTYGWNFYADNTATPPKAIFYANSTDATTDLDDAGAARSANSL
jgi:general secretion pathway protein G